MTDYIGKFVCVHIPNYKSYLGKVIAIDFDLFIVHFTDGDVMFYTISDLQSILFEPINDLVSINNYRYKLMNFYTDKNSRISKKDYDDINNAAFILCSLK